MDTSVCDDLYLLYNTSACKVVAGKKVLARQTSMHNVYNVVAMQLLI